MADWKYIMFEANGRMIPIIFPGHLIHEDFADAAHRAVREHVIRESPNNWSSKVVSAGFVNLIAESTYGKSESLSIESREEDREIINEWPYAHGAADESRIPIEPMMMVKMIELLIDRAKKL